MRWGMQLKYGSIFLIKANLDCSLVARNGNFGKHFYHRINQREFETYNLDLENLNFDFIARLKRNMSFHV